MPFQLCDNCVRMFKRMKNTKSENREMSSSSDEEGEWTLSPKSIKPGKGPRLALGKKAPFARRKSTGAESTGFCHNFTSSQTTVTETESQNFRVKETTKLFRSHSNTSQHDYKAQWATALVAQ